MLLAHICEVTAIKIYGSCSFNSFRLYLFFCDFTQIFLFKFCQIWYLLGLCVAMVNRIFEFFFVVFFFLKILVMSLYNFSAQNKEIFFLLNALFKNLALFVNLL